MKMCEICGKAITLSEEKSEFYGKQFDITTCEKCGIKNLSIPYNIYDRFKILEKSLKGEYLTPKARKVLEGRFHVVSEEIKYEEKRDKSSCNYNSDIKLVYDPSKLKPWSVQKQNGSEKILLTGWFIKEENARKVYSQLTQQKRLSLYGNYVDKPLSLSNKTKIIIITAILLYFVFPLLSFVFKIEWPIFISIGSIPFFSTLYMLKIFLFDKLR